MLILIILSVLLNDNQVTLKPKQKMVKAKTSQPGQPPQGREGELIKDLVQGTLLATGFKGLVGEGEEDVVTQIRKAVNDGWMEGDHGDVSTSAHQKEIYEKNRLKALAKHSNELQTVFSGTQSHALSPEPDPTRSYHIQNNEAPYVGGQVIEWQQLGCLQMRSGEGGSYPNLKDGYWELEAIKGPPLPEGFWSWSACEQAEWQRELNKQEVAFRMLLPEETGPEVMTLRPPSYFEFFSEDHDTCDPCYEEAPYFCEPCPREDPMDRCFDLEPGGIRYLPMALGNSPSDACVWEIDYQVGQVAPYEENWPKEFINDGFGGRIPVSRLEVGHDKIAFHGHLEDIVKIEAVR